LLQDRQATKIKNESQGQNKDCTAGDKDYGSSLLLSFKTTSVALAYSLAIFNKYELQQSKQKYNFCNYTAAGLKQKITLLL